MIALFLFAAVAANQTETDVTAQSKAGMLLCSNPDVATKTCSTIATYSVVEGGASIETAEILLSADQPVTLEMSAPVKIEGGTICGQLTEAALVNAKVRLNGALLPADRNSAALNSLLPKLRPLVGRQTCDGLRIEGERLMKYGQVDRIDVNLPGKPVIWIAPSSGYKVAPR
ncbi:hypothetical protein KRZ98_00860 [Sphingobium sp. AS12]|uniref:hypothetical protein n=1 Tax=Sphingobium sp. AS12 TaxID=2849495 RepID=UPI001C31E575|nr:hypothetical protein [Sphingobium sp. AS12]MBV2146841.1 hypothetical protein [Sphingobium sp. AS12]